MLNIVISNELNFANKSNTIIKLTENLIFYHITLITDRLNKNLKTLNQSMYIFIHSVSSHVMRFVQEDTPR